MTAILGIAAFGPDSAAALVCDGEVVAAAQEDRFTRRSHDDAFPSRAMTYCLRQGNRTPDGLDFIAFYDKPLALAGRRLSTYLALAPRGLKNLGQALSAGLLDKLSQPRRLRAATGKGRAPVVFVHRHESLAAGAFFPSPFDEAAVLACDSAGSWTTTAAGTGRGNRLEITHQLPFPHSLGLLSSAFAWYCGLPLHGGPGALMDLAPCGRPVYRDLITRHLIDLRPDGTFRLNMRFFDCHQGWTLPRRCFERLLGAPRRDPQAPLAQRHFDLAASLQAVLEESLLRLGRDLHRRTALRRLVLAGDLAHNGMANSRLLRDGPFESLWVQSATPTAGAAIGAALFVWYQVLGHPRDAAGGRAAASSLLGPAFDTRAILRNLGGADLPHRTFEDETELCEHISEALAQGQVVGWFGGRMEVGPNTQGGRSILADPRSNCAQQLLKLQVERGQRFGPFPCAVLREHVHEWFSLPPGQDSPYGLLRARVLERHLTALSDEDNVTMIGDPELGRRIGVARSVVPAVTHVDGCASVQTVDADSRPRLHRLLEAFHRRTGCPVLVNAKLGMPGEPLVCTPEEALHCFLALGLDLLVLENLVVSRDDLDEERLAAGRWEQYRTQFQLD
jgi:carbamoyltransferase